MSVHPFRQVNVFSTDPLLGNPLAVVHHAGELSDARMAAFANWTNLSETTFLLPPTDPRADYRVRIFTTMGELPFAGHPTLGSCYAWLAQGGVPQGAEIVQECAIGLVRIRRGADGLAFVAPPLLREGPLEAEVRERVRAGLGVAAEDVVDAQWVVNGPKWLALRLRSRAAVLAIKPDYPALEGLMVGVFAACDTGDGVESQFESRAFIAGEAAPEDPVTGSLNAGIARWLLREGLAPERYVISQGTALGRAGRVRVEVVGEDLWVGGECVTCIEGRVAF
ncbi:PhzF family phenazine biosynthesis protein [Stenotrophomonas oahuensis]|uniref:PhzF family phenazine biosynthesis protein n=1 Tax=Stenotrophomonas oahuensis TaxID=3003271 RepID=A0ABY9YT06_9GAMM|nr:PhzF family phenazine biosynthesis protein [Stenotrophomonas sp. A5586]WNH54084.1 PhzF family phenazine biosynthesis protein [Stenotrophomonas sp. A5586]